MHLALLLKFLQNHVQAEEIYSITYIQIFFVAGKQKNFIKKKEITKLERFYTLFF